MNMMIKSVLLLIIFFFSSIILLAQDVRSIESNELGKTSWLPQIVTELERYYITVVKDEKYKPEIDISAIVIYELKDNFLENKILIVIYNPEINFTSTIVTGFFLLDETSNEVQLLCMTRALRADFEKWRYPFEVFEQLKSLRKLGDD